MLIVPLAWNPVPLKVMVLPRRLSTGSMVMVRDGIIRFTSPMRPSLSVMITLWVPGVLVVSSVGTLKVATKLPLLSVDLAVTAVASVSVDTVSPSTVMLARVALLPKPLALMVIA